MEKHQNLLHFLKLEVSSLKLTLPMWLYMLSTFTLGTTGVSYFAGTMGDWALAGVNIGMSLNLNTMTGFMIGFTSLFDVYGPQLCGRNQQGELGRLMVKILMLGYVAFLMIVPVYVGFIFAIRLLPMEDNGGDSEEIRRIAEKFMAMYGAVGILDYTVEVLLKFFANQRAMMQVYLVPIAQSIIQILLCYLFVCKLQLGSEGIILGTVLSRVLVIGSSINCMYHKRKEWNLRHLITAETFKGWGEMFGIGVAGGLNLVFAYITCSAATYLSQIGGRIMIEVYSIAAKWEGISFSASVAFAYSSAIEVGNAIGEMNTRNIRYSLYANLVNTIIERVLFTVLIIATRHWFVSLFTEDPIVINTTANCVYIFSLLITLTSIQELLGRGYLIVLGRTRFVSIVVIISSVLVGSLTMSVLIFTTDLGVYALFYGIILEKLVEIAVFVVVSVRLDLSKEVKLCADRVLRDTQQSMSGLESDRLVTCNPQEK